MSETETVSFANETDLEASPTSVRRVARLLDRVIVLLMLAILLTVFWPVSRALFGPPSAPPVRLHDACDRALIRHTLPLAAPRLWEDI